jgi:hypothetical protein
MPVLNVSEIPNFWTILETILDAADTSVRLRFSNNS